MKVLVISNTTWDNSNSFGNTFSNLFTGMNGVELYNIACRHGKQNNSIVKQAVTLTDKSVLKSIYSFKFDPCFKAEDCNIDNSLNEELSQTARKKRKTISFIIRDVIWKLGRWNKSKTLNSFLEEVKPDLIYLPIYASPHICDFQYKLIKKMNVPVIGHVSDNVYGFKPNATFFERLYKRKLRKKLRKLIAKCSYLEVFAENMKEEYSKLFNKDCYLIGKGITKGNIDLIDIQQKNNGLLRFAYTGNLGDERYKSITEIAEQVNVVFGKDNAVVDVYSATSLTKDIKDEFNACPCLKFHGAVNSEEVLNIQKNADFVIHVEGFSKNAIHSAKMSFSTKIIDYLTVSTPIFAYGPIEVNSINVLKKYGIGIVACSKQELYENLEKIKNAKIDYKDLNTHVKKYLTDFRDVTIIQEGILSRMMNLVTKNENIAN